MRQRKIQATIFKQLALYTKFSELGGVESAAGCDVANGQLCALASA